jgi:hypothetical protein
MNALMINLADQRNKDLRDYAATRRSSGGRRRRNPAQPASGVLESVSIRRLDDTDAEALDRLAGRDSSVRPSGELLGAELDGRLIAAVSIANGEAVADPFTRTAEAQSLLQLRASQLRQSDSHDRASSHTGLRGLTVRPRRG